MDTLHEVTDKAKLAALAESMDADGWQGAPIVKWGEQLLTGTHRYTAAKRVLGWMDRDIPMIDVEDIFDEDGLDFQELWEEAGQPSLNEWFDIVSILDHLSPEIAEKYGMDIH